MQCLGAGSYVIRHGHQFMDIAVSLMVTAFRSTLAFAGTAQIMELFIGITFLSFLWTMTNLQRKPKYWYRLVK